MKILILSAGADTGGQGIASKRAFDVHGGDVQVRSVTVSANWLLYEQDLVSPRDKAEIVAEYEAADLVHVRNSFKALRMANAWPSPRKPLILHHHGTQFRNHSPAIMGEAQRFRASVYVSTLDLLCKAPRAVGWIPAPIDVAALASLRRPRDGRRLRIMHSPTVRGAKGTDAFLRAVEPWVRRGEVELVMVERKPWRECLAIKGTVDIFFDQVTFGYGNNALEAFAMGIPVVSGAEDPRVMATLGGMLGELPFYPASRGDLAFRLRELIDDPDLRVRVAAAGRRYVEKWHGLAAVTERLKLIYQDRLEGRMKPRCPICGTEDYKCGTSGHTPRPVDSPIARTAPIGGSNLLRVEVARGDVRKLTAEEAAHYGVGPLAKAPPEVEAKKRAASNKKRGADNKREVASVGVGEDPALD